MSSQKVFQVLCRGPTLTTDCLFHVIFVYFFGHQCWRGRDDGKLFTSLAAVAKRYGTMIQRPLRTVFSATHLHLAWVVLVNTLAVLVTLKSVPDSR